MTQPSATAVVDGSSFGAHSLSTSYGALSTAFGAPAVSQQFERKLSEDTRELGGGSARLSTSQVPSRTNRFDSETSTASSWSSGCSTCSDDDDGGSDMSQETDEAEMIAQMEKEEEINSAIRHSIVTMTVQSTLSEREKRKLTRKDACTLMQEFPKLGTKTLTHVPDPQSTPLFATAEGGEEGTSTFSKLSHRYAARMQLSVTVLAVLFAVKMRRKYPKKTFHQLVKDEEVDLSRRRTVKFAAFGSDDPANEMNELTEKVEASQWKRSMVDDRVKFRALIKESNYIARKARSGDPQSSRLLGPNLKLEGTMSGGVKRTEADARGSGLQSVVSSSKPTGAEVNASGRAAKAEGQEASRRGSTELLSVYMFDTAGAGASEGLKQGKDKELDVEPDNNRRETDGSSYASAQQQLSKKSSLLSVDVTAQKSTSSMSSVGQVPHKKSEYLHPHHPHFVDEPFVRYADEDVLFGYIPQSVESSLHTYTKISAASQRRTREVIQEAAKSSHHTSHHIAQSPGGAKSQRNGGQSGGQGHRQGYTLGTGAGSTLPALPQSIVSQTDMESRMYTAFLTQLKRERNHFGDNMAKEINRIVSLKDASFAEKRKVLLKQPVMRTHDKVIKTARHEHAKQLRRAQQKERVAYAAGWFDSFRARAEHLANIRGDVAELLDHIRESYFVAQKLAPSQYVTLVTRLSSDQLMDLDVQFVLEHIRSAFGVTRELLVSLITQRSIPFGLIDQEGFDRLRDVGLMDAIDRERIRRMEDISSIVGMNSVMKKLMPHESSKSVASSPVTPAPNAMSRPLIPQPPTDSTQDETRVSGDGEGLMSRRAGGGMNIGKLTAVGKLNAIQHEAQRTPLSVGLTPSSVSGGLMRSQQKAQVSSVLHTAGLGIQAKSGLRSGVDTHIAAQLQASAHISVEDPVKAGGRQQAAPLSLHTPSYGSHSSPRKAPKRDTDLAAVRSPRHKGHAFTPRRPGLKEGTTPPLATHDSQRDKQVLHSIEKRTEAFGRRVFSFTTSPHRTTKDAAAFPEAFSIDEPQTARPVRRESSEAKQGRKISDEGKGRRRKTVTLTGIGDVADSPEPSVEGDGRPKPLTARV